MIVCRPAEVKMPKCAASTGKKGAGEADTTADALGLQSLQLLGGGGLLRNPVCCYCRCIGVDVDVRRAGENFVKRTRLSPLQDIKETSPGRAVTGDLGQLHKLKTFLLCPSSRWPVLQERCLLHSAPRGTALGH